MIVMRMSLTLFCTLAHFNKHNVTFVKLGTINVNMVTVKKKQNICWICGVRNFITLVIIEIIFSLVATPLVKLLPSMVTRERNLFLFFIIVILIQVLTVYTQFILRGGNVISYEKFLPFTLFFSIRCILLK